MKKLILSACAFVLLCASASAQFMSSGSASSSSSASSWISGDNPDVINSFSVSYSPVNAKAAYDGETEDVVDDGLDALSLTWTQARKMMETQPLYLEYGAGLQWSFWSDSESEEGYSFKSSINFLSLKVPVSIMYRVTVPNTKLSLTPYAGLNLTGYLLGENKYTVKYDGESESESYSFFSKDDMEDEQWNRFVLGWHIGAKIGFGKYFFGIGYEGPVTNLYSSDGAKIYTNQVNISLGITF